LGQIFSRIIQVRTKGVIGNIILLLKFTIRGCRREGRTRMVVHAS